MLNKLLYGTGVTASALLATQFRVAEAASPSKERPNFAAVYDDEVPEVANPLPGTIEPSKPLKSSKLAEVESKVAGDLEKAQSKLENLIQDVQQRLEHQTSKTRQFVEKQLHFYGATSQEYAEKYRKGERSAADVLASLKSENEPLLPGAIYVLVAGLSGSIFARRRNFVVRGVAQLLFGVAAFQYFLPETFTNTRKLLWRYEQEQLPTLAQKHADVHKSANELKTQTTELIGTSEKQVKSTVKSLRQSLKEWTGL